MSRDAARSESSARAQLKRWSATLPLGAVLTLVEGELKAARSPGKKAIYRTWLEDHAPLSTGAIEMVGSSLDLVDILNIFTSWPYCMYQGDVHEED